MMRYIFGILFWAILIFGVEIVWFNLLIQKKVIYFLIFELGLKQLYLGFFNDYVFSGKYHLTTVMCQLLH